MRDLTRRVAPADEANFVLDSAGQVNVFLVAGVLGPGGCVRDGTVDLDALREVLRPRITAIPALCRRASYGGGRYAWVDAPPDLLHHVRFAASVDGIAGLEDMCADLMCQPLDRRRPLWELLLVPGAAVDGVGIVLRVHHAVADGVSAVALAQRLFDRSETPSEKLRVELHSAQPGRQAARPLSRFRGRLRRTLATISSHRVNSAMLLGQRSPRRGIALLGADIEALEAFVRPLGATVNDALLSAVASGFEAALGAAGEPIPALLPVSVPVALQRKGPAANQVGLMVVSLPLGEPDPRKRLLLIAAQTREEKARAREQGALGFMRGPVAARIMDRVAHSQRLIAGFVTNVPGPRGVLRLAGAPVRSLWPVAVLAGNVRITVAAISYEQRLCCSIHFDAAHVPGKIFARATSDALIRLSQ